MTRSALLHLIGIFALPVSILLTVGCNTGKPVVDMGGSEVVGTLVDRNSNAVSGAKVEALQLVVRDSSGHILFDTIVAKTVTSGTDGGFVFDKLTLGAYLLRAAYKEDSLILVPLPFEPNPLLRVDLGILTMVEPGSVSGTVTRPDYGPDELIICHIAGTSFMATADPQSGSFTISGIIPDTSYTISVSSHGYKTITVADVEVRAGETTVIPQPLQLEFDPDGSPSVAPTGLVAVYDTLAGMVTLCWNRLKLDDLKEYVIYYFADTASSDFEEFTTYDSTIVISAGFSLHDSTARTVQFQVAVRDIDNNEGPRSPVITFDAIPPSWLMVLLNIEAIHDGATPDSIYVTVDFTTKLGSVDSLFWWVDHPDSIIRRRCAEYAKSGSDTLLWTLGTIRGILGVTVLDSSARLWTDTVGIHSLMSIDRWDVIDSMNEERRYAGACVIDGKIYVFGGCKEKLNSVTGGTRIAGLASAEMFDSALREWTNVAPMNCARQKAASVVVGEKIYVMGGTSGTVDYTSIERYDPGTDTWELLSDTMPYTAIGASACEYEGIIYLIGGVSGTFDKPVMMSKVMAYDPQNHTWKVQSQIMTGRELHQSVRVGGAVLTIGGLRYDESGDELYSLSDIECFSPPNTDGCWLISKSKLSSPRFGFGAAVINNELIVIGGLQGTGVDEAPCNLVERYPLDWLDDSPITIGEQMPAPRDGAATVVLNNSIYVLGGSESGAGSQRSTKAAYVYYP